MRTAWLAFVIACSIPNKSPGTSDSGAGVGDSKTADAALIDAPSGPFRCLGQPQPTTAPPQITVSGGVLDLGTSAEIVGAQIELLEPNGTSDGSASSDSAGHWSITIQTQNAALPLHLHTTASGYLPTTQYLGGPLTSDSTFVTQLPTTTDLQAFASELGASFSATQGFLVLLAEDCDFNPVANVTFALQPAPRIYYLAGNAFSMTASETDTSGEAAAPNVPAMTLSIGGTAPVGTLQSYTLSIAANELTIKVVMP